MNRRLMKTLMQHVTSLTVTAADGESDAVLLQRFKAVQDEAAFTELVRRHGPMVWAVCRHLVVNHSDAEDAFQATFLALVRSASSIRTADSLGGFLHGVAVKVATKLNRSAVRQRQREARRAVPESDHPIPDAAWDELFIAVHEEVQQLPDTLRTVFVMCELQGVCQPDAAKQLGWKIGTLSGRLTKARQRLLQQLVKRGIATSVTASLMSIGAMTSSASVPIRLLEVTQKFPTTAAEALPAALLELTHEVIPMAMRKLKLLALSTLAIGSVGAITTAWVYPEAVAQSIPGTGAPVAAAQNVPSKRPQPNSNLPAVADVIGEDLAPEADPTTPNAQRPKPAPAPGTTHTQWEYRLQEFAILDGAKDARQKELTDLLRKAGNEGWEFSGEIIGYGNQVATTSPPSPASKYLVFKRPIPSAAQVALGRRDMASMGMSGGGGILPPGAGGMGMAGPGVGVPSGMPGMGAPSGMPGMGGPGMEMGGMGGAVPSKPVAQPRTIKLGLLQAATGTSLVKAYLQSNNKSPWAQVIAVPESNSVVVIGLDDETVKLVTGMLEEQDKAAIMSERQRQAEMKYIEEVKQRQQQDAEKVKADERMKQARDARIHEEDLAKAAKIEQDATLRKQNQALQQEIEALKKALQDMREKTKK